MREPVQVYLERTDSALLARLADELALPKAEVLRRGLRSLATQVGGQRPMLRFVSESAASVASAWPAAMAAAHDEALAKEYHPSGAPSRPAAKPSRGKGTRARPTRG
ncbi:MAG TPA: hypothetical protein VFV33_20715 [Gemmatimonadaceae bacterium]|nr:hypothetical protein [Gemmatimonadaceae bacterium]